MSSQHSMMTREIRTHQRLVRTMYFKVDGSAVNGGSSTTNGLLIGAEHGLITENGAGDYTIVLNVPGQRFMGFKVQSLTAAGANYCEAEIVSDGTSIRVYQKDYAANGAQADEDFFLSIDVSDAADLT